MAGSESRQIACKKSQNAVAIPRGIRQHSPSFEGCRMALDFINRFSFRISFFDVVFLVESLSSICHGIVFCGDTGITAKTMCRVVES
jgi:hypothetical protein